MSALTVEQAIEHIYNSVNNDNEDLDLHIRNLKAAMAAEGRRDIRIDPARLVHNNRTGRKMMQSYFKKRGVIISFGDA